MELWTVDSSMDLTKFGDESLTEKLQNIFPTDLKKLKVNQSKYSFLMKENGGIYDDLILTKYFLFFPNFYQHVQNEKIKYLFCNLHLLDLIFQ